MVGRVYRWRGELWRVRCRWGGKGPRNVLLERVPAEGECPHGDRSCPCQEGDPCHYEDLPGSPAMPLPPPEFVVRPFRGLRIP